MKILHVDNEPDTVEMVKVFLADKGYEIVTASSGAEALEKVKTENPDLVLLDIMMPDISGWDVYQKIKEGYPNVKVAFLSVIEVSSDWKSKLILSGLAVYILKPFTKEDLIERIDHMLKEDQPKASESTADEASTESEADASG